jgi:HK97 family phage prohead protease
MTELEIRAAKIDDVAFPQRLIRLIVMPYDTETQVVYQGRMITEVCARGAYDGIERRANRVRVNRDHQVARTIGRATAFHPNHDKGLVADLRIAPTLEGNETLALADEGILDASAGFAVMPDGETWRGRAHRTLTKLWLGHIAMTSEPAYETANVLAVRTADAGPEPTPGRTPNLDALWLRQARDLLADIDRRYAVNR